MSTFVDIHIIQPVPPSCLNRDDNGSPKTAMYGGVRRLRVSSQAWKRATRLHFNEVLEDSDLGCRTNQLLDMFSAEITRKAPELAEVSVSLAKDIVSALGIKVKPPTRKSRDSEALDISNYLVMISNLQVENLVNYAIECHNSGEKLAKKQAKELFDRDHSIDLSLFGRMIADDTSLNVDASCQVAHAISTHAVNNEFDFFTAVDDFKSSDEDVEDSGAGMMGIVEYNSGTLYRYATINLDLLMENLGDAKAAVRAVRTFIDSFVRSMPTGKQNTFANRTLPEAVYIVVRNNQPVSLVGAFERPVRTNEDSGYVRESVRRLVQKDEEISEFFGDGKLGSYTCGLGEAQVELAKLSEPTSFDEVLHQVEEVVSKVVNGAEDQ